MSDFGCAEHLRERGGSLAGLRWDLPRTGPGQAGLSTPSARVRAAHHGGDVHGGPSRHELGGRRGDKEGSPSGAVFSLISCRPFGALL